MKAQLPLALGAIAAGLAGCGDMSRQDKQKVYSPLVGPAMRPEGAVAFHDAPAARPPLTLALVERGQQRYRIYCTPCHSELGDGNGMIVQRGFPRPPSFHDDRLRTAPIEHFYDVTTNGWGAMYSFADRVQPADRWAIAAYIRALQRSRNGTLADLSPQQREALQ